MLNRLANRLSYANVVATLALFVALGGTSYAALKLPRNSVGSAQLRTGAVRSSDVRDQSLGIRDFSRRARQSLQGEQGPAGVPGPPGPAAIRHFAAVSATGGLVRGDATSGGRAGVAGTYVVGFAEGVSACAYSATVGTTDTTAAPPGRATVNDQAGKVGVQTFDAAGTPADLPFHLVVAC